MPKMRGLLNAVSRYLIAAGKMFSKNWITRQSDIHVQFSRILIEFCLENLILVRNFDFCAEVERVVRVVVPVFREKQRDFVSIFKTAGLFRASILKTVPSIRDSNMIKLG